mmetsp:Transcript_21977/g.37079  ORF Transcript_21977/g.37079 Transcript_21977/m.37079 type:complete len:283 (-) Transcript_21977:90-938(-)
MKFCTFCCIVVLQVLAVILSVANADSKLSETDLTMLIDGDAYFKQVALTIRETDKVTYHRYNEMYGHHLLPHYVSMKVKGVKMKMLEIGLGCGMEYGPGGSVKLWGKLFPDREKVELWEAEYNGKCVRKYRSLLKSINVNPLVGDQGNQTTLQEWIRISGGNFDVIIDDGGHRNDQIYTTLLNIWPALNPGGLFFVEDLHVGYNKKYLDPNNKIITIASIFHAWVESLIFVNYGEDNGSEHRSTNQHMATVLHDYPPLPDLEAISCYHQACVLTKKEQENAT